MVQRPKTLDQVVRDSESCGLRSSQLSKGSAATSKSEVCKSKVDHWTAETVGQEHCRAPKKR